MIFAFSNDAGDKFCGGKDDKYFPFATDKRNLPVE
jgi:hypothetical protein